MKIIKKQWKLSKISKKQWKLSKINKNSIHTNIKIIILLFVFVYEILKYLYNYKNNYIIKQIQNKITYSYKYKNNYVNIHTIIRIIILIFLYVYL